MNLRIKTKTVMNSKDQFVFEADTIKEIQKIAVLKNLSVSDIARDYVKKD